MRYVALALLVGCHGPSPSVGVDATAPSNGDTCVWSSPAELSEFSDAATERDPTETGDRLELYYTSDAAAGEILFASRASTTELFVRQALPGFDDPGAVDASPVVSADGLHLVFTSDRGGAVAIYESTRASRAAGWSTPQIALGGGTWPVGAGGIGMTTDASTVVFQLDTTSHCFTRHDTTAPFMPNCDDLSVLTSPAFDDAYTTVYYNCGTAICSRPMNPWVTFKTPGAEHHVGMGTPRGAADPWVEPGGDTILFAADHSLFRTTRSCN